MRRSYHTIVLDVLAKVLAKEIAPLFSQSLATRCGEEVHHHLFPTKPQSWLKQSFTPFQKRVLRIRERHKSRDKSNSLLLRKRCVVSQSVRGDSGKLSVRSDKIVPIREVLVHCLCGGRPDCVCVLLNLERDIDQRNHDRQSTDDLSEIGEIAEGHWFPCR